ncbi:MAG: glycerol-3-phosphate 1-O-acyltransferase PlsY [Acholeplasmataceae bacterium]|nr:glycerol-3-phosphate 1-O-acyltransferase PlsY [Acholeplasmataceae bacterium]
MHIAAMVFFFLLSYALGSVPSGLWIGKIVKNVDIREFGSKNTGATNAIRVLGFKVGIFAFVFDALKGALVMLILLWFNLESYHVIMINGNPVDIIALYGMVAVLGHVFPLYINFKGGKAVATSAGMILAIEPVLGITILLIFLLMFKRTRYVSLASTTAAMSVLVLYALRILIMTTDLGVFDFLKWYYMKKGWGRTTYTLEFLIEVFLASLIFYRHRQNYKRLREGTEHQF